MKCYDPVNSTYNGKPIPKGYPYLCILLEGPPKKDSPDHPRMALSKRAKIFAPFDALDGHMECSAAKNIVYFDRIILDESEKAELNRRLSILHNLTFNSRMARNNRIAVRITYYKPCTDVNHRSYALQQGQYPTVTGIVRKVDAEVTKTITLNDMTIRFEDITGIEPLREDLFEQNREDRDDTCI